MKNGCCLFFKTASQPTPSPFHIKTKPCRARQPVPVLLREVRQAVRRLGVLPGQGRTGTAVTIGLTPPGFFPVPPCARPTCAGGGTSRRTWSCRRSGGQRLPRERLRWFGSEGQSPLATTQMRCVCLLFAPSRHVFVWCERPMPETSNSPD